MNEHIVINSDKTMEIPEWLKDWLVQFDHKTTTITFDCPRKWRGIDLLEYAIYVSVIKKGKEPHTDLCTNVHADENDSEMIHFDWKPTKDALSEKGELSFLICARITEDETIEGAWHTKICRMIKVAEGHECQIVDEEQYEDIITELVLQMKAISEQLANGGGGGASTASEVSYDNSTSGLEAENVQGAVDELAEKGGIFVIKVYSENNDYVSDKTFDEIVKAYESGKCCVVQSCLNEDSVTGVLLDLYFVGYENEVISEFNFERIRYDSEIERLYAQYCTITNENISYGSSKRYKLTDFFDNSLDENSSNVVQNMVITKKINEIVQKYDGEINSLKGTEKTFKDMLETSGTETLTWNGNTEGKPIVLDVCYKVADYTPTMEDLANGCVVTLTNGSEKMEVEVPATLIMQDEEITFGLILAFNNEEYEYPYIVIVPDNIEMPDETGEGTVTLEKGTYFLSMGEQMHVSALKINGYAFGDGYKIKGDCVNFSESQKADIVHEVLAVINGQSVIGTVDENNVITITSDLASGNYTLKYENADGTYTDIGTVTVGSGGSDEPVVVNLANPSDANWKTNYRINSSGTEVQITDNGEQTCVMTNIFDISNITTLHVKGLDIINNLDTSKNYGRIYFYDESDKYWSYCQPSIETFVTVADYDSDVLLIDVAAAIADSGYTVIKKFRLGGFLTGTAEDVIVQADAQIV